eukprot:symbB.v1.2.009354.t1/scaffold561.1/size520142/22
MIPGVSCYGTYGSSLCRSEYGSSALKISRPSLRFPTRHQRNASLPLVVLVVAAASVTCRQLCRRRNRSLKYFEGFPQSLDYGLYFFGADGACQKHVKGQSNAYYVENKKTLIYVHGWEADRIRQGYRESFHWSSNEPRYGKDVDLAKPWLPTKLVPECRHFLLGMWAFSIGICSPMNLGYLMQKRKFGQLLGQGGCDTAWSLETLRLTDQTWGRITGESAVRFSCAELLAQQLLSLKTSEIRLAGHSLGSPLVIAAAAKAQQLSPTTPLRRIALLDPYWSRKMPLLNQQEYLQLPRTTAQESLAKALKLAEDDVLFEIYYSCPMLTQQPFIADDLPTRELLSLKKACMVFYDASGALAWQDLEAQHLLAPNLYLHSMRFAPGRTVPSAGSSHTQLRESLGRAFRAKMDQEFCT